MQYNILSNSHDIWTVCIPAQIVRSFLRSQTWQSQRKEILDQNTVATVLTDEFVEYTFIQNTHIPAGADETIYYQCYQKTNEYLAKMGISFDDVVRTWIYLDDIDASYSAFNDQRDRFYREHGVFDKRVPASTAIGIPTRNECKMVCHVLAARKLSDQVSIHAVPSPLQCSAMDYKVSFSRALEIKTGGYRRLLISGTASIDAEGRTVYTDSIEKQTEQTAKVTDALLASNAMTPQHITRLLSYTKRHEECEFAKQFVGKWLPEQAEVLDVHADICRDDLLFEIEAEAMFFK